MRGRKPHLLLDVLTTLSLATPSGVAFELAHQPKGPILSTKSEASGWRLQSQKHLVGGEGKAMVLPCDQRALINHISDIAHSRSSSELYPDDSELLHTSAMPFKSTNSVFGRPLALSIHVSDCPSLCTP